MLVNLSSYGLGYPRQYGDRVTNIRRLRRGLIEESLSQGGGELIREGRSIKYLLSRGRSFERGALSRKYGS